MFYLTTHSTHFIYGYMASDIWLRTILIVRKETRCGHIGYSYRLTASILLYATSHRQDNTYHGVCYTSSGALAGTRSDIKFSTMLSSTNVSCTILLCRLDVVTQLTLWVYISKQGFRDNPINTNKIRISIM